MFFFSNLLFSFLGVALDDDERPWFAGDGKEWRGRIAKGEKRDDVELYKQLGISIERSMAKNGQKQSERPIVLDNFR